MAFLSITNPMWLSVLLILLGIVLGCRKLRDDDASTIPGPPLTSYTNLWAFLQARLHRYSRAVHEQHVKHGAFVRISANHVSVGDPSYIKDVMGHGNAFCKSRFYEIFDWNSQSIFTTRSRDIHARKRRWLSATFSARSIKDFERFMTNALAIYGRQMEQIIAGRSAGKYSYPVTDETIKKKGPNEGVLDAAVWNAFLAFDIIGDLAFGGSFGYTQDGFDSNNGIQVLKERGEWCVVVGQMLWLRPWTPYLFFDTFFTKGAKAVSDLGAICTAAVQRRRASKMEDRKDILSYLLKARDPDTDLPLPEQELIMESLSIFIGGSDTTSNTITHGIDLLSRHRDKLRQLQEELYQAFPDPLPQDFVAKYSDVESLPYLDAVIHETLRLRPTISFGLPRVVPPGPGVTFGGRHFKAGTVLSISTYTVHRNEEVFGDDALAFNPDRWLTSGRRRMDANFMSFSYGPRACIGRNVSTNLSFSVIPVSDMLTVVQIAMMELKKTFATLFRRFNYRPINPEKETVLREGFHLKCTELPVYISQSLAL
ncbi:Benzoate 4-monooxygenase [Paramyrothecium foliicola]|nr:Benzoate 4-monooxygenase [Paramyrothecium foliicola]